MMKLPIILALDTKDIDLAKKWITASLDRIDHFKVGLEFYLQHGAAGIERLRQEADFNLFLDLKLYDIPNTVKGAVESVAKIFPKFLTVHAAGGAKMISEAAKALPNGSITAVTVLTSFSEEDFQLMGQSKSIEETTLSWANIALKSGATSLVCSPFEVASLRKLSSTAVLITPGVRLEGDDVGDQARVMSPKDALSNGANFVVMGRSLTKLWDGSDLNMRKKIELISNTLG
jgi:orotidine-5'-phosphate decarboxylase